MNECKADCKDKRRSCVKQNRYAMDVVVRNVAKIVIVILKAWIWRTSLVMMIKRIIVFDR